MNKVMINPINSDDMITPKPESMRSLRPNRFIKNPPATVAKNWKNPNIST